ncbi:hypothetical protein [Prosthecobacter sp.]|jgi:hypothetical protein|uniref:hypothetical protein n=1 Tax=Prosthecobacter sp. TaxID=1965333 RepID=UPI0025F8776D|nr:hypothetical protein [Prosthecobacter sp.]
MLLLLPRISSEEAASELATIRRAGDQLRAHPEQHANYLRKLGIYGSAKIRKGTDKHALMKKNAK